MSGRLFACNTILPRFERAVEFLEMYYKYEKEENCITKGENHMPDYDHICSIRGVSTKLLSYLAEKTSWRFRSRHRGAVVNEALTVLALLYFDKRKAEGFNYRTKALTEESLREFLGDLLDRPRPWPSPNGQGGADE